MAVRAGSGPYAGGNGWCLRTWRAFRSGTWVSVWRAHRHEATHPRRRAGRADDAGLLSPDISCFDGVAPQLVVRSEEHTSELQSIMRISYAVFCLKNNTS